MARTPDELLQLVKSVLEEVAGVKPEDVIPAKSLVDDLDVDSLAGVEVMVELEQQTGCQIPDGDVKNLKTVQDIIDYLTKKGA